MCAYVGVYQLLHVLVFIIELKNARWNIEIRKKKKLSNIFLPKSIWYFTMVTVLLFINTWYFRLSFLSGYPRSKQEHKIIPCSGDMTALTPFFLSSTQRTEFLSYFVDIISHLDRMFLCKISFSKTYSVSRIFNFFCRLLCYPFSLFIPLQPHCADSIKKLQLDSKEMTWHSLQQLELSVQLCVWCEQFGFIQPFAFPITLRAASVMPERCELHSHQVCRCYFSCNLSRPSS